MGLLDAVYLLALGQVVFVLPVLWLRGPNRTANRILSIPIALIGVSCAHMLYLHTGAFRIDPRWLYLTDSIEALYGPLFYLYTRAMLQHPVAPARAAPHFVVFVAVTVAFAPRMFLPGAAKLALELGDHAVRTPLWRGLVAIGMGVLGLAYFVISVILVRRFRRDVADTSSAISPVQLRWLQWLLASLLALWVLSMIGSPYTHIGITVVFYAISYFAMAQPQVAAPVHTPPPEPVVGVAAAAPPAPPEAPETLLAEVAPAPPVEKAQEKYVKTRLREETAAELETRLMGLFTTEKPYLDPELTSGALADRLGISTHNLSQVLNDRFGKTFYDFVNLARVREVERRLRDPRHADAKIATIGLECGFSSKSAFNANFKKHTGRTPTEYRSQPE